MSSTLSNEGNYPTSAKIRPSEAPGTDSVNHVKIDLSGLPDLTARPYRGSTDHMAMSVMINRWCRAAGIDDVTSVEDLDHNYAHLENCDPAVDMVMVVDSDDRVVGYTRIDWWQVVDGERKYAVFGKVDPDMLGTGLVDALLRAAADRSETVAANHDIDSPKVLEGWADDDREREFSDAYRGLGFRPVTFGATMVRPDLDDIPGASLPDGVEIRPVEASHLRSIWEADKEAFRDHWGYAETTEEDWHRFLEFPHRDESLWKVAWAGDTVVGQVRSFINEDENAELGHARGWTEFISTHREWRKQGIARALICESLRQLGERGMSEAGLGVHVENPNGAFGLYESLGYRVTERTTTFQRPIA
jgi:ribosomal protein S18 acetylase RimI-like enzyme